METKLYEHNEEAYKKAVKMIAEKGKAAIVHPTGTGKMFIAAQWLIDNPSASFLFLAPTYEIINQFEETLKSLGKDRDDFPFLETAIYNQGKKDVLQNTHFDKIVLDEFHRAGAPVWGETVDEILKNSSEAEILGLTATPVRVLDNQKDMAEILFDDAVASEMTLEEAIADEILPCPIYVASFFTCMEEMKKLENKVDKMAECEDKDKFARKIEAVKQNLPKLRSPAELIKTYAPKNGKFIVFCESEKDMVERYDEVEGWMREAGLNAKLSCIFNSQSKEENQKFMAEFRKNTSSGIKLMFSINMLNEGVHIEDIDGVIMLRHTNSPILYRQQLGRGLSAKRSKKPIIFDFVDNYEAGNQGFTFYQNFNDLAFTDDQNAESDFVFVDEYKPLRELVEEVDLSTQMTWEDWFDLAKKYSQEHGDLLVTRRYVDDKGHRLGVWIMSQRTAYNNRSLSDERKAKLDSIGMVYDVKMDNLLGKLKILDAYLKENKISINEVPWDAEKDGVFFGKWIQNVKSSRLAGKASPEVLKEFEKRGIIWETKRAREFREDLKKLDAYTAKISKDSKGKKTINEISRYEEDENGFKVGLWLRNKRISCRQDKLEPWQVKELEKRGIAWDLIKYDFYKRLKMIDKECELKQITINDIIYTYKIDDFPAGTWVAAKKSDYKDGKLLDYQVTEFENRGIKWDTATALFYETLELVKEKCLEEGIDINDIPYSCEYKGVRIGVWLSKKQTLNNAGGLPNYQKKELSSLGLRFKNAAKDDISL